MAKRTAVVDIGSNSARLVIYEKTGRFGFHLIAEQKSKVRIGEGAYEKNGYLQPPAVKRAFLTLRSFKQTIEKYDVHKTLCVATSALRDAPNAKEFVRWIKTHLNLHIRIIDGKTEALYGGIAASNLLPLEDAVTVDIGGGSADMALIRGGKVVETFSIDLGTVRLKELFYDKAATAEEAARRAEHYIETQLKTLPSHFLSERIVGIGGTVRTLGKSIMKKSAYPFDKLHAYTFEANRYRPYLQAIPATSAKGLKRFNLKKSRFDTIREGTLIFLSILDKVEAKEVVVSAVGVREGVFLEQLLKKENLRFPKEINPSVVSILERFKTPLKKNKKKAKFQIASALCDALPCPEGTVDYKNELKIALRLSHIGNTLTIYKSHQHAFYIAMQELNYRLTHRQILLVAMLLRMHGKRLVIEDIYATYETLLPPKETFRWLSFIYTLTLYLHDASNNATLSFFYENATLEVKADQSLHLAKEAIKGMEKPAPFAVVFKDKEALPKCKALGIL